MREVCRAVEPFIRAGQRRVDVATREGLLEIHRVALVAALEARGDVAQLSLHGVPVLERVLQRRRDAGHRHRLGERPVHDDERAVARGSLQRTELHFAVLPPPFSNPSHAASYSRSSVGAESAKAVGSKM